MLLLLHLGRSDCNSYLFGYLKLAIKNNGVHSLGGEWEIHGFWCILIIFLEEHEPLDIYHVHLVYFYGQKGN